MQIEIFTTDDCFEDLKSDWNDLLLRIPTHTIFSTCEWASSWWMAYKPGKLWLLTYRTSNNQLIGLAPCFIDEMGIVRGIGCEDVTDYYEFIIDPQYIDEVLREFVKVFVDNKSIISRLEFCNFREHSLVLEHLSPILSTYELESQIEQQDVCPIIELPHKWDDYLAQLPKKQRHEIRRKLRRADGSDVSIKWYTVDKSYDIDEEIDKFIHLMATSDQQKNTFLQDDNNHSFFRKIVPLLHERGWLQLNFLTVNNNPVATYLNFVYRNHVLVYNSGLDATEFGYLSPGIVLLAYNIRSAIDSGYEKFDFLRGDETYKYRMGGQDTSVFRVTIQLND